MCCPFSIFCFFIIFTTFLTNLFTSIRHHKSLVFAFLFDQSFVLISCSLYPYILDLFKGKVQKLPFNYHVNQILNWITNIFFGFSTCFIDLCRTINRSVSIWFDLFVGQVSCFRKSAFMDEFDGKSFDTGKKIEIVSWFF